MHRRKPLGWTIFSATAALVASFGSCPAAVNAAVYSWGNVGSNWTDASNWDGDAPDSGDVALFDMGSYNFQPTVPATAVVGGIWDTGSAPLTIGGGTLTLRAAPINGNYAIGIEMDAGSGPLTITAPLALSGAQYWINNSALLNVQGNVADNGYAISVEGSGNTTVSGAISGAGDLNMFGSGLLQLGGQDTYSGATIVDGGTLQLPGGALASPTQYVGYNYTGAIAQSGGGNAGTTIYLAYSPGSSGSYNLSGGSISTFDQVIGYAGGGSFAQSGGTNTFANTLRLGNGTAATGSYYLTDGLLSGNEVDIGVLGNGSVAQSGGSVATGNIYLGFPGSASGIYSLSGGLLSPDSLEIGNGGNGVFIQSGGTNSFTNFLEVGPNSSGTYSLTAGRVLGYEINLGISGNGSFMQSGGLVSSSNALVLGFSMGGSGAYSLSGSGVCSNPYLIVGYSGSGSFQQSGGTNSLIALMEIGSGAGSVGAYNLIGGLISGVEVNVGGLGSGAFVHSGGSLVLANPLVLGFGTASVGTYNLSGSGYICGPVEYIGYSGSGTFTQSGGTNAPSGGILLAGDTASAGTYNLNGGVLLLAKPLASGSGSFAFNFGGGTLQAGGSWATSVPIALTTSGSRGTINTNSFMLVLNGPLSGPGGLTLADTGNGTLILATSNGYLGGTRISSGSLQLGDPAALGGGALVATGGTLDLSGYDVSVAGLSGAAGTITDSSGASSILTTSQTGTTTFGGSLQDGASQASLMVMGGGKLFLTGTNTYTGGTTVTGGVLVVMHSYSLATGTDLTVGNSASLAPAVPNAAGNGTTDSLAMPVPEPAPILLISAVFFMLAAVHLRKGKDL